MPICGSMEIYVRFYILVLIPSVLALGGCSIFSQGGRPIDPEPGFRQQLAPVGKSLPLPVEIAQDIAEISENGVIQYGEPSLPEAKETKSPASPIEVKPVAREDVPKEGSFATSLKGPLGKAQAKIRSGPLSMSKVLRKISNVGNGSTISYIVKLGDTLMEIAFDNLGDFLRWREIYKVNRSKMSHYTKMHVGTELSIPNAFQPNIRRVGQPYKIRKGDTLAGISTRLYGRKSKWHDLWRNNPELIRNPKKLYAGFTLYYQPESN
jgi:nucleoid-associated protein YgaU